GPRGGGEARRAAGGMYLLPPLTRVGLYQLKTPAMTRTITVRPADPPAGRIRPGEGPVAQGAGTGGEREQRPSRSLEAQVPVWPWLVLTGVPACRTEWALATRRRGGDA